MKKIFATATVLASIMAVPAFAQEFGDTAGGIDDSSMNLPVEASESLALLPGQVSIEGPDMAVGAGFASQASLALSDEQLEKIAKLKAELSDSQSPKMNELRSLSRQLKDALSAENPQKGKVMEIQSKINSLKADLSNARLNAKLETLAVLNPEQKQKLRHASLERQVFGARASRGGRRGHGMQKRGRFGGPGGACPGGPHAGPAGEPGAGPLGAAEDGLPPA